MSKIRKILLILALAIVLLIFITGGLFFYRSNKNTAMQVTEDYRQMGLSDASLIASGDTNTLYRRTTSAMKSTITPIEFSSKLSGFTGDNPSYLPSQVTKKGDKYYVTQPVTNLNKTPKGKTEAIFELEYANEEGWRLNAVTVQ